MRVAYEEKAMHKANLDLVVLMNKIMAGYQSQGFKLTVRQLYYQLVTRNAIANNEKQYGKISRLCNDARMGGLMDWDMIEDRTRAFISRAGWLNGGEILSTCADQYHEDLWQNQGARVFVIVEKEALAGVLEPVCNEMDMPLLAARGYPSVSVLHAFAEERIIPHRDQCIVILHLGDHDPSGLDMTRDLRCRLSIFTGEKVDVRRIALNMDQVEELNIPPNPAKMTDKRFTAYAERYGASSWELDALPPEYLASLVRDHAEAFINTDALDKTYERINLTKIKLQNTAAAF